MFANPRTETCPWLGSAARPGLSLTWPTEARPGLSLLLFSSREATEARPGLSLPLFSSREVEGLGVGVLIRAFRGVILDGLKRLRFFPVESPEMAVLRLPSFSCPLAHSLYDLPRYNGEHSQEDPQGDCLGWMGVIFQLQLEPLTAPSENQSNYSLERFQN